MQLPLLKNSDGKSSITFTMMIIGFIVVTLWLLLSIVEKIAGIEIRQFNGTEAMLYLVPLYSLYAGRKQQDLKTLPVNKKEEEAQ